MKQKKAFTPPALTERSHFLKKIPCPSKRCLYKRMVSHGGVVVNLENGAYYTLNEIGQTLWEAMNGRRKTEDIIRRIAKSYSVSQRKVRHDIEEHFKRLGCAGLICFK